MPRLSPIVLAVTALLVATAALAQETPVLTIGYLDLGQDPRYDDWGIHPVDIRSSTAITDRRAWPGAQLGLNDIERLKRVAKTGFALRRETVDDAAAMTAAIARMRGEGIEFFLIDAPGPVVAEVARAAGDGAVLFNTTATDDMLRNDACQAHLFHTAPSQAMMMDALAQFLVSKKWHEVLVLKGPLPEDAVTVKSFERAADLFGLDITDTRDFVPGADPRAREQNDLDFLTGRADYDVVFVADTDGEFALAVPYGVQDPAPVVGAAGLVPRAWHWSHTRNGAPQVHGRFERMHGRRMLESDWGAWVAMKLIGEAVARGKSTARDKVEAYLKSEKLRVVASKGPGMNFRPWSNQLRQPIYLTTGDWVAAKAPLAGFKHRTNNLDTLGIEERETTCKF